MSLFTSSLKRPKATYAAPWAIVGSALILALAVAAMAAFNVHREQQVTSRILSDKGAALIRAFEAGVRTGMMGSTGAGERLQTLIDETASESDILFIVVADSSGQILSRDQVGDASLSEADISSLAPTPEVQWSLLTLEDGREAFVVYAKFLASPGGQGGQGHQGGQGGPGGHGGPGSQGQHHRRNEYLCPDGCDYLGQPVDVNTMDLAIFMGMDIAPYSQARAQDIQRTVLRALVMFALGFAAVASLFWAHNYRSSRRELLDARALATEVVTNLPEGLIILDRDQRVAFVNDTAQAMLPQGVDYEGKPPGAILPPELLALVEREGAAPPVLDREMDCSLAGGDPLPLAASVAPIITEEGHSAGHVVILRDLRQVRRLEHEVRRREKLAALGDLAAGVAHEIRNPLSSIRGYAALFAGRFPEGSDERQSAQLMAGEADRLNKAVSNLLEFARTSEIKPAPHKLADIADHTLRLVRQDAEQHNVTTRVDHDPNQLPAFVDGDRFTQVLLNVLLNAIQAMESQDQDRSLVVRTTSDLETARIEVSDTGQGMTPEQVGRVFDPYFSTKPQGTGLGMAITHAIVEAHAGRVEVASEPGQGTTVAITLPLAREGDG